MEIIRGEAEAKFKAAGAGIVGQTFRELMVTHAEDNVKAHPIQNELVARAVFQCGAKLDDVMTPEMIDRAGAILLAELQDNGLLK